MPSHRKNSEDIVWQGEPGSNWTTAANWTLNRIPAENEVVNFPARADIVLSEDQSVAGLCFYASGVFSEIAPEDHTEPVLTIGNRGLVNYGTQQDISVGVRVIGGAASTFPIHTYKNGRTYLRAWLDAGNHGVEIKGTGTTIIREIRHGGAIIVGGSDKGNLHIAGTLRSLKGIIGASFGGVGIVSLVGANIDWHCCLLQVGAVGRGSIIVGAGATVTVCEDTVIGEEGRSSGEMLVKSGRVHTGNLRVGAKGQGTLRIEENGSVESGIVHLGSERDSYGAVRVARTGSWTIAKGLVVGEEGIGELYLEGRVEVRGAGVTVGSVGVIRGSDAVLSVNALTGTGTILVDRLTIDLSEDSTFHGILQDAFGWGGRLIKTGSGALILAGGNAYTGVTVIREGALFLAGSIATAGYNVASGAALGTESGTLTLESNQTLKGSGSISGNLVNMAGSLFLGSKQKPLRVDGEYTQKQFGIFVVEIASDTTFGMLQVGGAAEFQGGEIQVKLGCGFAPAPGQHFDIITAGAEVFIDERVTVKAGWEFIAVGNIGRLTFTNSA